MQKFLFRPAVRTQKRISILLPNAHDHGPENAEYPWKEVYNPALAEKDGAHCIQ
jgi:hypothetical protein